MSLPGAGRCAPTVGTLQYPPGLYDQYNQMVRAGGVLPAAAAAAAEGVPQERGTPGDNQRQRETERDETDETDTERQRDRDRETETDDTHKQNRTGQNITKQNIT